MKVRVEIDSSKVDSLLNNIYEDKLPPIATAIESTCKIECPVKTGALQADIKSEVDTANKVIFVGNDLEYSVYVNLGTRKTVANPYLIRGRDSTISNVMNFLGE